MIYPLARCTVRINTAPTLFVHNKPSENSSRDMGQNHRTLCQATISLSHVMQTFSHELVSICYAPAIKLSGVDLLAKGRDFQQPTLSFLVLEIFQ